MKVYLNCIHDICYIIICFQRKSEIIATFALCSFANPGSIGSMIATMTTLCPSQRSVITRHVFRAFIGGTVTCFLTSAIASKCRQIIFLNLKIKTVLKKYLYDLKNQLKIYFDKKKNIITIF